MRIGEAIALDTNDIDNKESVLTVRSGKFGKARELALHATTVHALRDYLQLRARSRPKIDALFVSTAGTRLLYSNVKITFRQLTQRAGLTPRCSSCRPRLHDLRHSFAVNTILDGYRSGANVQARLAALSTWLHTDPSHTYWYLSAAPELLALVGRRLDQHAGGGAA